MASVELQNNSTKIAITAHGLDVYTSEVDNRGLDFVTRNDSGRYLDIQVKSIKYPSTSYVFITPGERNGTKQIKR